MTPDDPYGAFVARCDPSCAADSWRVAVKDMIAVAGMPQPAGFPGRDGMVAARDAAVVTLFRDAGHTIVGVTTTDAAGFGTMTNEVRHPRHPLRAVGGSSGGSAAAVAAGLADVGIGTDTGGSVRIPAAYCELYAFKPSRGRVSLEGVLPLSPTLDHVGVMAATPAILARAA
ncbi:MAG: amidase family protein, partial [Pseudomonadota bacterium]